ncbi:MAG TPA: ABC transporter ATP-binding protein [Pseudogracilibacillus sp.]|nr:ABC transporter ATP-binding protein [Pseudogracilibacillus sp.]
MHIEVKNLSKKYGRTFALKDVSFTLEGPKIYGLLGRNGAGKTTFMDILAGQQRASSGTVLVNNEQPFNNKTILNDLCIIKESNNFQKDLTIKQVLKTCAILFPNWDANLAEKMLGIFHLSPRKKMKKLSKGMASAVGIIVGLASRAPLTIFDEPYIGLDAASRKKFYELLLEQFEEEERTIILSTHLIDEVSLLFEEVIILQEGELMLQEEADTLRDRAFSVTGEKEAVKQFICDKQVINTKEVANMMTAAIYGDRLEAEQTNLTVEGLPIQDLMIYLTEKRHGA